MKSERLIFAVALKPIVGFWLNGLIADLLKTTSNVTDLVIPRIVKSPVIFALFLAVTLILLLI